MKDFNTLMEDFANIWIIVFFFSQKVCLKELKKGLYKDHARCQIPHKPSQNQIPNHSLNMFLILPPGPIKMKRKSFSMKWSTLIGRVCHLDYAFVYLSAPQFPFVPTGVDWSIINCLPMIEHLFIFSSYVLHFEWFKNVVEMLPQAL
jgi:hypothetical protein